MPEYPPLGQSLNPSWQDVWRRRRAERDLERPGVAPRAPIDPKYESLPLSGNIDDRRMEPFPWLEAVSKQYSGFSTEQWKQALDALINRPFEPMNPTAHLQPLHTLLTSDPAAQALGYNDIPVGPTPQRKPFWEHF